MTKEEDGKILLSKPLTNEKLLLVVENENDQDKWVEALEQGVTNSFSLRGSNVDWFAEYIPKHVAEWYNHMKVTGEWNDVFD